MPTEVKTSDFINFDEFYAFYLLEHKKPMTKLFHCLGTSLGLVALVLAIVKFNPLYIPLGIFVGYLFPWISHFFIEHNMPATFKYPAWSFKSDFKMYFEIITFKRKLANSDVL
ncbi:MAG: DUF962 domain-containing protein [Bacteriovoracaceae bacterium]|jgi:hypothetical protein|nr:DUF962 domain-containing protein [Bacteriovoracaceae bacterium]